MPDWNPVDWAETAVSKVRQAASHIPSVPFVPDPNRAASNIHQPRGGPSGFTGEAGTVSDWFTDHTTKPVVRWGGAGLGYGLEAGVNLYESGAPHQAYYPGVETAQRGIGAIDERLSRAAGLTPLLTSTPAVQRAPTSHDLGDILWRGTTLGQMVAHGGGTGYLPPQSAISASVAVQRQVRGTVGSHAATPGRVFAGSFLEPDSLAYNIASGAVDAYVAFHYDPSIVVGKAWHNAQAVHTTFLPNAAAEYEGAGIVDWVRKRFAPQTFNDWMDSWKGRKFTDLMVGIDPGESQRSRWNAYAQVRALMNGKADMTTDLYQRLAHASTTDEVRAVMADAVNSGLRDVPKVGWTNFGPYAIRRMTADERLLRMQGGGAGWWQNPQTFLPQFENTIVDHRLGSDARMQLVGQMIEALSDRNPTAIGGRVKNVIDSGLSDLSFRSLLGSRYWGSREADTLTGSLYDFAKQQDPATVHDALVNSFSEKAVSRDVAENVTNLALSADSRSQGKARIAAYLKGALPFETPSYANESVARNLTRYAPDAMAGTSKTWLESGEIGGVGHIVNAAGGEARPVMGAHLLNEMLHGPVYLGDSRAYRRQTSLFANLFAADANAPWWRPKGLLYNHAEATPRLLLSFMDAANAGWKALEVARPAVISRILGDGQLALASANETNAISHPNDYFALLAASKTEPDLLGETFASQRRSLANAFAQAVGTDANNLNKANVRARSFYTDVAFHQNYDKAIGGWAGELSEVASDPIGNRVAKALVSDDPNAAIAQLKADFYDGPQRALREGLMAGADALNPKDYLHLLNDRGWSDGYIDSVARRIGTKTAGQDDLLHAIADNAYAGKPFGDHYQASPQIRQRLRDLVDDGITPGETVKARMTIAERGDKGRFGRSMDQVHDWIWDKFITVPSEELNKSPLFRDTYWKEVDRMLPGLSPAERASVEGALTSANDLHSMRNFAAGMSSTGQLTAAEVDGLAKATALSRVHELLYNAHQRSNLTDAMRIVFPFGEVFRQQLSRWGNLAVEEAPRVLRRGTQAINDLQESGVVTTDPRTGKEMIHIPVPGFVQSAVGALTQHTLSPVTDQGMQFQGPVQGLSIFSQGLPGAGAVAAVPISEALKLIPGSEQVQKDLLPYGAAPTNKGFGGFLQAFLPGWAQKMATAWNGPGQREFVHTMHDVMVYLSARNPGRYGADSQGTKRLLADARDATRTLYYVRGLVQAFSPTAPSFDQQIPDQAQLPDGKWAATDHSSALWAIQQRYYNIDSQVRNQGGTSADAAAEFLNEFGPNLALVMVPKTVPLVYGLSATTGMAAFKRANASFASKYPDVWPLFAPTSAASSGLLNETGDRPTGSNFSYFDYLTQLDQGDRKDLTSAEMVDLAQYRVGQAVYDSYRNQVGVSPNTAQRAWLDQVKAKLAQAYPRWAANAGQYPIKAKVDPAYTIGEAVSAAEASPSNPISEGIMLYAHYRAQALDAGGWHAGTSLANQDAGPSRAWLRNVAAEIARRYSGFGTVFDTLFANEVQDTARPDIVVSGP